MDRDESGAQAGPEEAPSRPQDLPSAAESAGYNRSRMDIQQRAAILTNNRLNAHYFEHAAQASRQRQEDVSQTKEARKSLDQNIEESRASTERSAVQEAQDARREITSRGAGTDRRLAAEPNQIADTIRTARQQSDTPQAFVEELAKNGLQVARVTKDEATAAAADHARAEREGRYAPRLRENEYVVVAEPGQVLRLTPQTTGENFREIQKFMAGLDGKNVPAIEATKQTLHERAASGENGPRPGLEREGREDGAAHRDLAGRGVKDQGEERGEIDTLRVRSDPDYRRQVQAAQKEMTQREHSGQFERRQGYTAGRQR